MFLAEVGIRVLVRSRGLGKVYKRQYQDRSRDRTSRRSRGQTHRDRRIPCLLYIFDAADEEDSVFLGVARVLDIKIMVTGANCCLIING